MTWAIQWQQRRRHDWNDVCVCAMCACVWLPPPYNANCGPTTTCYVGGASTPASSHVDSPTAHRLACIQDSASTLLQYLSYNQALGRSRTGARATGTPASSSFFADSNFGFLTALLQCLRDEPTTTLQPSLYLARPRRSAAAWPICQGSYTRVMRSVVYLVWVFRCRGR